MAGVMAGHNTCHLMMAGVMAGHNTYPLKVPILNFQIQFTPLKILKILDFIFIIRASRLNKTSPIA
jgi:hypothetical protein